MWTEGGCHSPWGCPERIGTSRDLSPVKKRWHGEFNGPRLLQHKGLSSCSGTKRTQSAMCFLQPSPEFFCFFFVLRSTVLPFCVLVSPTPTTTWGVPVRDGGFKKCHSGMSDTASYNYPLKVHDGLKRKKVYLILCCGQETLKAQWPIQVFDIEAFKMEWAPVHHVCPFVS